MRSIGLLIILTCINLPKASFAQYALGDGRGLERDLRLPQAPLRDPFAGMQRRQFPLTDGLGGQRFDDRFVRDGLRFAPEFQYGNSIYSRSLIFDYLGYSGWDLQARRDPLTRPENRFDQIKNERPRLQRQEPEPSPSPQRYDTRAQIKSGRIDTRVPTNRIDTRMRQDSPRADFDNRAPIAIDREPLKSAHLSHDQMLPLMVKVLKVRKLRRDEEKKIFGNVQDRNLTDEFWERRGLGRGRALSLIGVSPSVRFEEQIFKLSTEQLLTEAKNLRTLFKEPPADLDLAIEALESPSNAKP